MSLNGHIMMNNKNKYELLWHIRPIRRFDNIEYIQASDLVVSLINNEEANLINGILPRLNQLVLNSENKYDSLLHNEQLTDDLFINVLSHTIGERTHFKLYRGSLTETD